MSALTDMILAEQVDSHIMGYQLLTSISGINQSLKQDLVNMAFADNGFGDYTIPITNANDAWRRATSDIACKIPITDNEYLKVAVIPVNEKAGQPLERIVQVTYVDKQGRKVSEGKNCAQMTFNSVGNIFTITPLPFTFPDRQDKDAYVEDVVTAMTTNAYRKFYDQEFNAVSMNVISYKIRKILGNVGHTYKRVDAAWFVPADQVDTVDRVKTLFADLSAVAAKVTGDNHCFYVVTTPVYSSPDQQKQVKGDFVAHVMSAIKEIDDQSGTSSGGENRTNDKFARLQYTVMRLTNQANAYKTILNESLQDVDKALAMVNERIQAKHQEALVMVAARNAARKSNRG